jgi:hypothetical protein
MSDRTGLRRATFTDVTRGSEAITVHFNPVSLQIQLANTMEEKGKGAKKKQYVTGSTAKLTMDLVFDSTDTGSDVRETTGRVAALMEPEGTGPKEKTPSVVLFEWGTFAFQGVIEQYKETLDFFSEDGVPLRASVNVTIARQDLVFAEGGDEGAPSDDVEVPAVEGDDVTGVASRAGNPGASRAIAAANGLDSIRFPSGAFTLDASIQLKGAVAFSAGASAGIGIGASAGIGIGASAGIGFGASAGAGFGASAGAGFGASAGAGFGASAGAGFGASASAGFGASAGAGFGASAGAGFGASAGAGAGIGGSLSIQGPAFGAKASAGRTAAQGAFAGLRVGAKVTGPALDPTRLLPRAAAAKVATEGRTSFRVGGRANAAGSASFLADVGAGTRGGITFDTD